MMRVVIDTNILISGLLWDGLPGKVYQAAIAENFTLITTSILIAELQHVITRTKFAKNLAALNTTAEAFIQEYQQVAQVVEPVEIPVDAIRDPKDRAVLGCAVGGKADIIVSGDQDLLVLGTYQNIKIVTAETLLTFSPYAGE